MAAEIIFEDNSMILTDRIIPLELDLGESCRLELPDGSARVLRLRQTAARVLFTTLDELKVEQLGARTYYEFTCDLEIDGEVHHLRREVPTQRTLYQPWQIAGLTIWFDAVLDIFDFLTESHGTCRPNKQARFAIQTAGSRLCPQKVELWCPLPPHGLTILDCYCGEDCWLGPYFGADAHGGLDINHPQGTPIYAPLDIHQHGYFNSLEKGHNNNCWRGFHYWPDGTQWIFECYHMTRLTVPENLPIQAGQQYADGAGVLSGMHQHSHFVFGIRPLDQALVLLDPWILFHQMHLDHNIPFHH
jgi:hypothetical protein